MNVAGDKARRVRFVRGPARHSLVTSSTVQIAEELQARGWDAGLLAPSWIAADRRQLPVPVSVPGAWSRLVPSGGRIGTRIERSSLRNRWRKVASQTSVLVVSRPGASAIASPRLSRHAGGEVVVSHVVDMYSVFSANPQRTIAQEKADYDRSDWIFTIGEVLRNHVLSLGISPEKVENLGQIAPQWVPVAEPNPGRHRAIWVGDLNKLGERGSAELALGAQHANVDLLLVSPAPDFDVRRIEHGGVRVVGPCTREEVRELISTSTIGLAVYGEGTQRARAHGQNPLKMHEYMALGLPVIASPHAEFAYSRPPVTAISERFSSAEVVSAIQDVIHRYADLRSASILYVDRYRIDATTDRFEQRLVSLSGAWT